MAALDAVGRMVASRGPFSIEIKPEHKYNILRGSPRETEDRPFFIRGKLVVTAPHRCSVKAFKIFLYGTGLTIRPRPKEKHHTNSMSPLKRHHTFVHEEQLVTLANGEPVRSVEAGVSEFAFEWKLKGDVPDTVAGLKHGHVRYDMKAVIDRPMWQGQIKTMKQMHIIRTLPVGSTLLTDPWSTEGVWEAKGIKYTITTTSQAAALGDVLSVQFEITHLDEKVVVKECELVLVECVKYRTTGTNDFPFQFVEADSEIKKAKVPVPGRFQDREDTTGLPRKRFTYNMALPRSLDRCRQSIPSSDWIQIRHRLHCHIYIANQDGHVSRVQPRHDIHIFISERRPVEENGYPGADEEEANSSSTSAAAPSDSLLTQLQEAPPQYSTHHLDRLYDGVDDSLYNTPAPSVPASGTTTPGIYASRRGSGDGSVAHADHSADLANRLRRLEMTRAAPAQGATSPQGSRNNSYVGLSGLAGQSSVPSGYNMQELERLQSYGTAVRTPPAPHTAGDGPPSYVEATSQPPSPTAPSRMGMGSRQHSQGQRSPE